jgi:hypothetical protein
MELIRLRVTKSQLFRRFVFATALLTMVFLSRTPVVASGSDPLRYQSGVRISPVKTPGKKQVLAVIKSLRAKTGFADLDFDSDGFLRIGDESRIVGGSKTARELLAAAIDGEHVFDLENHNSSRIIAFARIGAPISYRSLASLAQIEVLPIEIDFSDFDRLRGDPDVIAAFDLGMVLLHELAHGALQLPDTKEESVVLGQCETHINQIRRELELPERQTYLARVAERPSGTGGSTRPFAELIFTRVKPGARGDKRQFFFLSWEAQLVGQLLPDVITRQRSGTIVMN